VQGPAAPEGHQRLSKAEPGCAWPGLWPTGMWGHMWQAGPGREGTGGPQADTDRAEAAGKGSTELMQTPKSRHRPTGPQKCPKKCKFSSACVHFSSAGGGGQGLRHAGGVLTAGPLPNATAPLLVRLGHSSPAGSGLCQEPKTQAAPL
jgi:hypothetical protein